MLSFRLALGTVRLRVALVHDWLTGMRGGEKVLEVLFQALSAGASVYAAAQSRLGQRGHRRPCDYNQSPAAVPWSAKKYRLYFSLFPAFAELTKVRDCELVISTSHAVAKSMVSRTVRRRPRHVCYIHSPIRYVWDRFDDYFGPQKVGTTASRFFFKPIAAGMQGVTGRPPIE